MLCVEMGLTGRGASCCCIPTQSVGTRTTITKVMRTRYQHFHDVNPYFVTCTTVNWIPVFTSRVMFNLLVECLQFLRKEGALKIYAYVILENHVHMVAGAEDLGKQIGRFKSYTARKIIDLAESGNNAWLLKQLREGKKHFKTDRTHQLWQEGFHPQRIYSEKMLRQKVAYIHNNPVRRGYVEEAAHWIYSSARNYLIDDHSVLAIDSITV